MSFWAVRGVKRQKISQNKKKQLHLSCTISQEQYSISSWFLVHMCKMKIFPGVFFHFKLLKIGQKMAQNGKKFCLVCFIYQEPYIIWLSFDCFNDISVNANPISVRLKLKWQHINTVTFYIGDILMPLVGVFSNI